MLLRYYASNFQSIGHALEFSMLPSQASMDDRFQRTISTKKGEWKVLLRGGLLGPNASGKSSFMKSLAFARDYIVDGQRSGKGTGIDQFRGDMPDLDGTSLFQFTFFLEGEVYEYGFTLDSRQVHEEWLLRLEADDFHCVFSRSTDCDGTTSIEIGSDFANDGSSDRQLVDVLKASMQEEQRNQLFLYKLFDNGIGMARDIIGWFRRIQVIFPESKIRALPIKAKEAGELRSFMSDMLKRLDTGVCGISTAGDEIDFYEYAEKMKLPKELVDDIEEAGNGIVSILGKHFIFAEGAKGRTTMIQLIFNHQLNDSIVGFSMDEESEGTQRLIDLLPMLFSIGKSEAVYFVDEIDRSLHTKLSQFLLDGFVDDQSDAGSQIVFTAHDVNLIDLEKFRQDEIWFIEKDGRGESHLRPLSDFAISEGQDALKAYLCGRFGAVPLLRGV